MLKKFIILFILAIFSLPFFPQTPITIMDGEINYLFNERLTGSEILALRNGEVVCNSIGKLKYSRINAAYFRRKKSESESSCGNHKNSSV